MDLINSLSKRGVGFYPAGDTVEANRWYHVVCTYNKDTRTKKLYVDGVYKNGGTITTGAYSWYC